MFNNLLKKNRNFIFLFYNALIDNEQGYKEGLEIINNAMNQKNNESNYKALDDILNSREICQIEQLMSKNKIISKIISLNQKLRSIYCLLENNFVFEMHSIFRNLIEYCSLFVSTELLIDKDVIKYNENDSEKIKKLFCTTFQKPHHNPANIWSVYEDRFGKAFDFDIQFLYKHLSNEFVHSRTNFEDTSERIYNPFIILEKTEKESLNDPKWISEMENELQRSAKAIKDIFNCTIGSIVDVSCRKALDIKTYKNIASILYPKEA